MRAIKELREREREIAREKKREKSGENMAMMRRMGEWEIQHARGGKKERDWGLQGEKRASKGGLVRREREIKRGNRRGRGRVIGSEIEEVGDETGEGENQRDERERKCERERRLEMANDRGGAWKRGRLRENSRGKPTRTLRSGDRERKRELRRRMKSGQA